MARTWWSIGVAAAGMVLASGAASAQGSLIPPALYPVQGAPFTATVEFVWNGVPGGPPGSEPGRRVSKVMRDSEGRQRYETPSIEQALAEQTVPQVTIYDVPGEKIVTLDVFHKKATVRPIAHVGRTVTIDPAARRGYPCHAPAGRELLGVQTIAGLEACGQHFERTQHGRDGDTTAEHDLWLSTNYLMPLMEESSDETRGMWTQKVIKLEAGEPDPALFQVPADYEVVSAPDSTKPRDGDSSPAPDSSGIAKIGGKVSAPAVLFAPEPEFSEEARHDKVSGSVLVYLQVDENGLPMHVRVLRGAGHGLDEKAVEAVKQYKFRPAMQDGHPVTVEMNVMVNFQIYKKAP